MKPHNHEAVKVFEANSRDNEQIHGGNVRRVVSQKGPPSLAGRPGNFLQLEGGAAHHRAVAETLQHDPSALIAEPSDPGPTDVCPNSIGLDRDHINAVGSHPLIQQVNQPPLVPASTAVPTAATKQQNEKHNDEKRGGIHVRFPRNAACCAAWNSGLLTTFSRSSGSRYPRGEMARS